MIGKRNAATALRNRLARLVCKASFLAGLLTLAFPSTVLSPHNQTVHEKTTNPDAVGIFSSAHSIKASYLPSPIPSRPGSRSRIQPHVSKIAKLPLYFEANEGQNDEQVKFVSRGRGYRLLLSASEAVLELQTSQKKPARTRPISLTANLGDENDADFDPQTPQTVRVKFVGARAEAKITGVDELRGKSNYFIGNDPAKWRKNIPQYAKVRYEEIYPGIDLVFYGNDGQLEFDFIVAPGADSDVIRLAFEGTDRIETDQGGNLTLETSCGSLRLKKPLIYQETDGIKKEISGQYILYPTSIAEDSTPHSVAFQLASYDPAKALVIDPGLEYSTFLGWSGLDDGNGIALDPAGNVYVAGSTGAGYGVIDVFVAKFSGNDFSLLYTAIFGGTINGKQGVAGDWGRAIAVDADGNAYITGRTESEDFPTTDGTSPNGYSDVFLTKLSSDGSSLLYSTRFGGSAQSDANAIALDTDRNAYLTGWTASSDFPTTPGAFDTVHQGSGYIDAFVAKLSADGSQLLYSTFLGGSPDSGPTDGFGTQTVGQAIAVDAGGNAHVTGSTVGLSSSQFPTTPGAFDTSYNGGYDAFVVKLNRDGSQLLYSTFLGGGGHEAGVGIALDATGNAYVTGSTDSSDFPTTSGAFERILGFNGNPFVVKLSADGSTLLFSTFFGEGTGASGIAIDAARNIYVAGTTCAEDFPTTTGALSRTLGSSCFPWEEYSPSGDGFVVKLDADGSRLLYSTFLGGSAGDGVYKIAVDQAGNVYATGSTRSSDFPTTPGSFEPGGGPWDAFVAKLSVTDTDRNPGMLGFNAIGYSVREDAGSAIITVIRRNGKDGEVSVDYATTSYCCHPWLNWTPVDGLDYIGTSGTLVFAAGETIKSFTIPILDDGEHEDKEIVVVTLSNIQGGATLGGPNPIWLTINDNDGEVPVFYTLSVTKTGTGSGTVGAGRQGINCGPDCSETLRSGTPVLLIASPAVGSTFAGWNGGGCSGASNNFCEVVVNSDMTVTATFNQPTAITVASANGGETWQRKKKQTIRWSYSGNPGNQVKIDLLKAGVVNQTISTGASMGTSGTGSLTWTVPKKQTLGSDYAIRICSISSPSICDTSDGNFSITK